MYEITLNGKTLYHPNSLDCVVTNAVIHGKLNDSGYMDITVPHVNPMYDEILERRGKIIVYKDNVELWYGEVRDISVDFSKNKSLYIVGEAAYMNDTVQPQKQYTSLTKFQLLAEFLKIHNSMVEKEKQFQPGVVGHNANYVRKVVTDWEYTLDAIRNHLCDDEEYVRIRHVNNVRYVDIMPLENYGKRAEQTIMFGENLLDYSEESSGENIATVCIPLGQTVEDDNGIENHENYLTCEKAPGQNGKNYVYLPGAVKTLGWITKVVHFNVLNTPEALVTAGMNYLQSAQYAKLTLSLTAVDLSILENNIDNYNVGDYVRAICEPFGMDSWFPVRERETDLLNIANNKIVIGAEGVKSITQQQNERIESLEKAMPSRDSILYSALKSASNLINANGKNGHVSIRLNEKGEPYEVLVMNANSIEQSTRAWRWNLNGFGHGTKKAGAADFTWEANVAMTMDGEIVAEKGVISGFRINKGKTLDGETTDFLQATTTDKNGTEIGNFTIGHKTGTGKSVLLMQFRDIKAKLKKLVGIYENYVYVAQTDLNGNNEKGTKIEPLQIITDGSIYAYQNICVRKNDAWYNVYDGISTALSNASIANSNASTAQTTANEAKTTAKSAYDYADSVNNAQRDNYNNSIKYTDDISDAINKRCDAIFQYAQSTQQYVENVYQLVKDLHGLN